MQTVQQCCCCQHSICDTQNWQVALSAIEFRRVSVREALWTACQKTAWKLFNAKSSQQTFTIYLSNWKQKMAYHIKGVFRSVRWHFLFCLSAFVTVLSWWPSVCGKCCLRCMRFLSFSATLLNWAARTVPQDCPSSRTICCAHDLLCRDKWHQRPVVQSAKENDGTTSFLASEMWREYHIKFFLNSKHGALTLPWIMMKAPPPPE